MPSFEESGLIITLPEGAWFRFADQPTYKRLCNKSLKEMDFGCYTGAKGCLELFELKDYSEQPELPRHLVDNLVSKGRDSLLMLHAAWSGRGEGRTLGAQLPNACRNESKLRLYFVIKLERTQMTAFAAIRDMVRPRVQVYADVLGLAATVNTLDHVSAMRRQLPITEAVRPNAP